MAKRKKKRTGRAKRLANFFGLLRAGKIKGQRFRKTGIKRQKSRKWVAGAFKATRKKLRQYGQKWSGESIHRGKLITYPK